MHRTGVETVIIKRKRETMDNLHAFKTRCATISITSGIAAVVCWAIIGSVFEHFAYSFIRYSSVSGWDSAVIQVLLCVVAAAVLICLVAGLSAVAASLLIAYRKDAEQQQQIARNMRQLIPNCVGNPRTLLRPPGYV